MVGADEAFDIGITVDLCRIIEIGTFRLLMTFAEAHQRLVSPGIAVEDRNFDDPGLDHRLSHIGRTLDPLDLLEDVVRLDDVRVELDLERGVGRADFGYALDLAFTHARRHRQALEESFQRHLIAAFDEQMFVASE